MTSASNHSQFADSSALRIVSLVHSFDPGGVECVALRLCMAWQADGAEVTVLVGRREGALAPRAPALKYVSYSSGPVPTRRFETLWMIICMWRWLRANRPDVIFCPGNTYTVVAAAMRIAFGRKCPPIICKVSNSLRRREMPALLRFGYELWLRAHGGLADAWVAMIESLRGEITEVMGVPYGRVVVVEDPALSMKEIERHVSVRAGAHHQRGHRRLFVSVGRLVPQKRFDLLIRAFCSGGRDSDELVVLGDGPLRRSLQKLIDSQGAGGRIKLVGHTEDVIGWLAQAEALVLTSDYEGLPAVVVEALASGVPILATRCSDAMDELVGHGRFGRLVACNDEAALSMAIGASPSQQLCAAEARQMAERFTVDRAAPIYLRIMTEVVKKRSFQVPLDESMLTLVDCANGAGTTDASNRSVAA